jgi:hypothetical protein
VPPHEMKNIAHRIAVAEAIHESCSISDLLQHALLACFAQEIISEA